MLFGHKDANIIAKGVIIHGTHSFEKGFLVEVEDLKKEILELKEQDGVTLSGGDPFFQIEPVAEIAEFCKQQGLNVWAYTGFTFEELLEKSKTDKNLQKLMNNIDVLVDGKFILEQKSLNILFRGSTNQRILDMKKSLEKGVAVEDKKILEQEKNRNNYYTYKKDNNIFI